MKRKKKIIQQLTKGLGVDAVNNGYGTNPLTDKVASNGGNYFIFRTSKAIKEAKFGHKLDGPVT